MKTIFNKEEKGLNNSIEKNQWVADKKADKSKYKIYAKETLKKDKRNSFIKTVKFLLENTNI